MSRLIAAIRLLAVLVIAAAAIATIHTLYQVQYFVNRGQYEYDPGLLSAFAPRYSFALRAQ